MDVLQLSSLSYRLLPCATVVNRPQFFTLFHPAMCGEKLRLTCLIWPDDKPDDHIEEVELDNNRTVMFLRKLIKDEYTPRLDKVAASDLILWKCSIPADDPNLKETLNAIHFDAADTYGDHGILPLKPYVKLVKVFVDDPAEEHIHIIVQRPAQPR